MLAMCIVLLFLWHLPGPQPQPPLPEFTASPYHLVHLIPKPPKAAVTIAENKPLPDLVSQDELDDSHEQESEGLGFMQSHVEDDQRDTPLLDTDEYDSQEQPEDAHNLQSHRMNFQIVGETDSGDHEDSELR